MALFNSQVCLHSLPFAVFEKTMQELENFLMALLYRMYNHHHLNIIGTTFGDCASKIWYRLVMSNLLIVDY